MISLFFATMIFPQAVEAEIYKWVDEKGGIHFTEDPFTIPEQFKDKVRTREMPDSPKQTPSPTNRGRGNSSPISPPENQTGRPRITERKGLGDYEINAFLNKYATVQHDEYAAGSYTAKSKRKGDSIPRIGQQCLSILAHCPGFDESEFRGLVERYATYGTTEYAPGSSTTVIHDKGEIIPDKIPSLLRSYCRYEGSDYVEDNAPGIKTENTEKRDDKDIQKGKPKTNPGAIDTRTGEFYPAVPGGIINPRTGQFMPDVGGGYIDPRTGRFIPKN